MKRNAFTLIEIVVVIGVILLIMVSISEVMFGFFSSQSRNKAIDKIDQSSSWILDELKKNVLNAKSDGDNGLNSSFNCPMGSGGGTSMVMTNVKDNEKTTISCLGNITDGYKIASISGTSVGTTVYLFQKNNDLVLNGCDNFVTCSTLPSLQLSMVKFNFNLGAGVSILSSITTKSFSIDVTLRN